MNDTALKQIKQDAKTTFKDIDGFNGIGLSEGKLVVYLRDEQSRERFPETFKGIEILPVVTGKISAGAARAGAPHQTQNSRIEEPQKRRIQLGRQGLGIRLKGPPRP